MIIGGLEKFSLIDYPEHLSAIVFTKGCNFRCQFCYNPMLVWPDQSAKTNNEDHSYIEENDLLVFLRSRIGKLDAVVVTGGEPTLHADLPEFLAGIKKLGFKIKLDSNGTNPEMLKTVIDQELVDYLAMDIKAAPQKYDLATGVQPDMEKIKESIKIIKNSGLPYEFRTTVVPELATVKDISEMGEMISGADKWYLQKFKSDTALVNRDFENFKAYADDDMQAMREIAKNYAKICEIRG